MTTSYSWGIVRAVAHECSRHGVPAFGLRCCYADLKIQARRGEELTDEELDFIGMRPNGHKPTDGWREPNALMHLYELDDTLSAEDSAMLQALMSHPRADQLEFLA